jgi:hypothetical protein
MFAKMKAKNQSHPWLLRSIHIGGDGILEFNLEISGFLATQPTGAWIPLMDLSEEYPWR